MRKQRKYKETKLQVIFKLKKKTKLIKTFIVYFNSYTKLNCKIVTT